MPPIVLRSHDAGPRLRPHLGRGPGGGRRGGPLREAHADRLSRPAENGHEVTDFIKRGAAEWTITVKKA